MVGKFFLIAFFCVSLTQVHGNELEEAIKNGLNKVQGLYESGQKRINASFETVTYKQKAVGAKTKEFTLKIFVMQEGTKKALREVAQAMEEKAKETNKPETVFECIRKAETKANKQVQNFTQDIRINIANLEKSTLLEIQSQCKTLFKVSEELKVQYQYVITTIQACKTTSCVDNAVNGCSKWLDRMNDVIGQILGQMGNTVGNYGKDISNNFRSYMNAVMQTKSDGIRDIKKCVLG